jgi:FkbM family methyltransferase
MTPLLQNAELVVPGSEELIPTASYSLAFQDQAIFAILVNRDEQDEITAAIANQTYTFPQPFELLPLLTRPGDRVLDLGAHIGTFSLLAATLGYEVAAMEASPRNAILLQASAQHNHFGNLRVIPAAVSNRTETLEFIQAGPYGLVATPLIDAPVITVQATTVDAMLADLGWESVRFIKMDVEGSEVKAIAGMTKLLSRDDAPAILYESNGHTLHYFGETPNSLTAALERFGYTSYLVEAGQLIPLRASEPFFNCTTDCLATKTPPTSLPGWQLRPPLTRDERIAHILEMAAHPHPHVRSYIARTLGHADLTLLLDRRVLTTVQRIADDPDPDVRGSATWLTTIKGRFVLGVQQIRSWLKRLRAS